MKGRVLLVEDDRHNRAIAAAVLRAEGFEVFEASDGEQALERVGGVRPDVVLLDLSLPKLDGTTVARRLKADPELRAIPLVALTAHALAGDEEKAREAGCDAYLAKPVDPEAIVRTVSDWVGRRPPCRSARA